MCSSIDSNISLPIGAKYKPKSGKTGNMMTQILEEVRLVQTCLSCLERTLSKDHIIKSQIGLCDSSCDECLDNKQVCQDCSDNGQVNHLPALRRCSACCTRNIRCVRCAVLVVTSDCESGNKKAFEMIAAAKENGTLPIEFVFACLPDAAHVGKSIKCGLANWMLVLMNERANLVMLHRPKRFRCSDQENFAR